MRHNTLYLGLLLLTGCFGTPVLKSGALMQAPGSVRP